MIYGFGRRFGHLNPCLEDLGVTMDTLCLEDSDVTHLHEAEDKELLEREAQ